MTNTNENLNNFYDTDDKKKAIKNFFLNKDESSHHLFKIKNSIVAVIDNLEIPAWTLSRYLSVINSDDLLEILEFLTSEKEKQQKYQFFLLLEENELFYYQQHLSRYQIYLEHKILPKSLTEYENIDHDILSYQLYEKTMMIYLCVLKNEYRTF